MNITIRLAKNEDSAQLAKIFQNEFGYANCTRKVVENKFKQLDSKKEAVFVAVDLDKGDFEDYICGVVHIELFNALYVENMADVPDLAVSEEYHRHGIGRMLLQKAENWAKENSVMQIRLISGANRTKTHKFYRALGYENEKMQMRFVKSL
ncbi:MAG: GNAT family N-acetyltransferase [Treponema sp.]|nr:GNAT family N-acetyltransferase [Treponema sp.]